MDDSYSMTSIPLVSLTSSNTPISYLGTLYYSFQLKLVGGFTLTGDSIGVSYRGLLLVLLFGRLKGRKLSV
jgi:hypothetical protein